MASRRLDSQSFSKAMQRLIAVAQLDGNSIGSETFPLGASVLSTASLSSLFAVMCLDCSMIF
jgi:hypothetical protein